MSDCIQCLSFDDFGHLWIGTDPGLCVYNGLDYWMTPETTAGLPKANLRACACALDGTHYFATPFGILIHQEGVSIIRTVEMTLAEKAAYYQKITEKYHVRRDGFVTVCALTREGDLSSGHVTISDNDGLWTGCYAAAQCFRYAVTSEPEAASLARRSILAMVRLAQVTGIPGFTARAIRYPGEEQFGNGDPEWQPQR